MPLKKAGRTYKGLCPFHSEKTPSFHVDPDKGFFHCFGCGAGGDVFEFLELHEKVGFVDAVRMLAQKFGLSLPELEAAGLGDAPPRCGAAGSAAEGARDGGRVLPRAARIAVRVRARDSSSRTAGSRPETIEELGLGYAPPCARRVEGDPAEPGISRKRCCCRAVCWCGATAARCVDRFRHRLMVPICRDTGSVDRIRRPADGCRPGRAEVPEFARDADLLEEPHAVRPESDEGSRSGRRDMRCWSRATSTSPRCISLRQRRSSPRAARR